MSYKRITYQNFSSIKPIPPKKGYRKIKKRVNYRYDALNRITSGTDDTTNYNLDLVQYDKNGNITKLKRQGHTNVGATNFGTMDDLTYSYDSGNKLMKVADAATIDQFGFKDDAVNTTADTTDDYTYDTNGNLLTDTNKGITSILYNHLNMPTKITVAGANAGVLDYIYSANGIKLQKKKTIGVNVTTTDYASGYIYENNSLKQFNHKEGYVEPDGSNFQYVYQYKDLKNTVRLSYSDIDGNGLVAQNEIKKESNYYPFGLTHQGYNNSIVGIESNIKTYQGQEFTKDLMLNTHHWKYRVSDPAIGRFWQIDPLASDYVYNSTYAFSENRVIDGVELEGLEYINANDAKIEARGHGVVKLKIKNLNWFSSGDFELANMDPANWAKGEVGVNTSIGSFSIEYRNPIRGVKSNQMKTVGTRVANSTGQIDRRFGRTIGGLATSTKGRASFKGLGVMAALDFGLTATIVGLGLNDIGDIKDQQKLLGLSFEDLKSAIQDGMIDSELMNLSDLTDILNVIFQGESNSDNPAIKGTGDKIYNHYNIYKPVLDAIKQQKAEEEFWRKTGEQIEAQMKERMQSE